MNDNETYSRSNLNNNYSQIDSQSYSNLYKYNNSINKCENCQKLISQNDNTQSEIGKSKTEKDYLISINEYEKIKFEINKCRLEIRRVVRNMKHFKSNNEYLWSKYNKLNDSNKHYLNKNKIWKLQVNKSKINHFNYCLQNKIDELGKRVHCLKSKNEILHKCNKDNENLNLQLIKYETDLKRYQSEVNKYVLEINKIEKEKINMQAEIEHLKSDNENSQYQYNQTYHNQYNNLGDSNKPFLDDVVSDKLQNKIKELQIYKEDIINLEPDNAFLIDLNIEKENLASQLIIHELKINEYKLEICSFETKNEKYKSKCGKYKLEIKKLKYEIENLKLQIINYETEMRKYESILSKYESGINEDFDRSRIKIQNINEETPIGFENSNANCFLNCVVQQFYSCNDFRNQLIQYHRTSQIANSKADDEKKIFVNNFCKLMEEISGRNERKIQEYVSHIQKYFKNSSSGDDVHKCFMNILTVVSDVTNKQVNIKKSALTHTTLENSFEMYRNQNEGFVFDLFYGQIAIKLVCTECNHEFSKRFQLFKSIPLPVPKTNEMIPLENVIKNYLTGSPVDNDDNMKCQCPGGSKRLFSLTEFTHMPSYLFIYLNRGSYFENGEKNNTFINCNENLTFPTGESSTKYRLISVIDHIGDNYGGHYYAKSCFETDQWWTLNDSFVNLIEDKKSIVTKQAIVFLFKKD